MAVKLQEITLTHEQTNLLRRVMGEYGGGELPVGGNSKELADAVLAEDLGKVSHESVAAIRRLVNHEIPAVLIHGLPLGSVPYGTSREPADPAENGISISRHVLAALAGATGRKSEDRSPMVILNTPLDSDRAPPDHLHRDREDFTILLCARGNYHTGSQLAASDGKTDEHHAKTTLYLLKDVLRQPAMKKKGISRLWKPTHLQALMSEAGFYRPWETGALIVPVANKKGRLVNNKLFSIESVRAESTEAYEAYMAFREALNQTPPSFEVELKRGDAIIFDQAQVVAHSRNGFIAHANPEECRRLESRICIDEPAELFSEQVRAEARARLQAQGEVKR